MSGFSGWTLYSKSPKDLFMLLGFQGNFIFEFTGIMLRDYLCCVSYWSSSFNFKKYCKYCLFFLLILYILFFYFFLYLQTQKFL